MRSHALRLAAILAALSSISFGQAGAVASHEIPVLGVIGAGILAGGVFSVLKMRHQK